MICVLTMMYFNKYNNSRTIIKGAQTIGCSKLGQLNECINTTRANSDSKLFKNNSYFLIKPRKLLLLVLF